MSARRLRIPGVIVATLIAFSAMGASTAMADGHGRRVVVRGHSGHYGYYGRYAAPAARYYSRGACVAPCYTSTYYSAPYYSAPCYSAPCVSTPVYAAPYVAAPYYVAPAPCYASSGVSFSFSFGRGGCGYRSYCR